MERIVWDNFSKQLTQFSYFLEADEGDGQNTSVQTIHQGSHTFWRRMERIGYDTQMRGIQTFDELHVHPGEDGIG